MCTQGSQEVGVYAVFTDYVKNVGSTQEVIADNSPDVATDLIGNFMMWQRPQIQADQLSVKRSILVRHSFAN